MLFGELEPVIELWELDNGKFCQVVIEIYFVIHDYCEENNVLDKSNWEALLEELTHCCI